MEPQNKTQLLGSKMPPSRGQQRSGPVPVDVAFWEDAVSAPIPKVTAAGRKTFWHVRETQKYNKEASPCVRDSDKFYPDSCSSAIAAVKDGLNDF